MLQLKMIIRSWSRAALNTMISMVSLTLGLTCSTILVLFVLGERQVAHSFAGAGDVYLVKEKDPFHPSSNMLTDHTSPAKVWQIKEHFPAVQTVVSVHSDSWRYKDGKTKSPKKGHFAVTSDFASLFDLPVVEGNLRQTLASKDQIAVSNSFMLEVFGRPARIGDRVVGSTGNRMWYNGKILPATERDLVITTILSDTRSTPFSYGALNLMEEKEIPALKEPTFGWYCSFIKLAPHQTIDMVQESIKRDTVNFKNNDYTFTSIDDVYFSDRATASSGFIVHRDAQLLSIGLAVALAVLLIAAFNYVNITMTRARSRLRNIAAQRIFGASARAVRWGAVLDTALMVVLCFAFSLLAIYYVLPSFNSFMDSHVSFASFVEPLNLAILVGLLVLLVLLPSFYILYKTRVTSPLESLKNPMGRSALVSSVMVVGQFVISIVLVAVCLNITRQMNFIASERPSAATILRLQSSVPGTKIDQTYLDRILASPWVESYSTESPMSNSSLAIDSILVNSMRGDENLIDFYGMQIIEGRSFAPTDSSKHIIVNETFVRKNQLTRPVEGQVFDFQGIKYVVIGVVRDFMYESAHKSIESLMINYNRPSAKRNSAWGLFVKVTGNPQERADELRTRYATMVPGEPMLEIKSVATIYKEMHASEQQLLTMVTIFMYISALLTALGLFGLAFYTVGRRTKEIALRRVHGSTRAAIVWRLMFTFVIWVGIACVIATPIAYYLSQQWLASFTYHVPMAAWVFALTILFTAVVGFLTVIYQTWKAASTNPARFIKAE
ncbi:MAG: FtsX-like permease family protein [Mucinivorans sp.]